jgi:hypothetical protein
MDIDQIPRPIGRRALLGAAAWLLLARAPARAATVVTVYKDPT